MENTNKAIPENLYQDDLNVNLYEYILEDGEELTLKELKELNAAGYVYHSEQTDIDFEDEFNGAPWIRSMNIYYFSKAAENIHENQIPA
jgi:hypothetical protein